MQQKEFLSAMKYLSEAYGKDFTSGETAIWYDNLKEYDYQTFKIAVKEVVKKSKFKPTIAEMIERCEEDNDKHKFLILEMMRSDGYFKESSEYEKAMKWLETGVIPEWFKKDMENYHKKQLSNTETKQLEERKLLGGI